MKRLAVFDMFYSIQGEGEFVGMPAFFIRLAGCDVGCDFCDEKRAWHPSSDMMMEVEDIISEVKKSGAKNVVITGGEPSLFDLTSLTQSLASLGIKTFLETSGTNLIRGNFFHITLSPKQNRTPLIQKERTIEKYYFLNPLNSLKVVIATEEDFLFAEKMANLVKDKTKTTFYLQPEWSQTATILPKIIDYVKQNNLWHLSLQMHKYMNIK
ncbi:MAG: 7-carboxy-7-deazaguanine synthase QueE [Bacteroidota bacterium]|nr:7-carboxy-7-deazaguanine synthase QueE [Bacteroidota bacterium]